MYSQDYDSKYPGSYWNGPPPPPWNGNWVYWSDLVLPYVKNNQIFYCPSTGENGGGNGWSYGMPWWYWGCADSTIGNMPYGTAGTAMLIEGTWAIFDGPSFFASWQAPYNGRMRDVHNDGLNIAYADGHAKWTKVRQVHGFQCTGGPVPSWGWNTDDYLQGP